MIELGIEHKFEGTDRMYKTNRIRRMKEIIINDSYHWLRNYTTLEPALGSICIL